MNKQNSISKGTSQISQIELFTSGVDGYHTYRIPALIVATDGTILAFCEGRKNSARDDGDIDIVLKRSFDNGRTWQGMQIIVADGDNTMGNPCPVVDRDTGVIWLPLCKNNDQVYIMNSEDNGATWSNPMEITKDVKLPSWGWYATGPGHGIQLDNGRLVIPCDHRENNILHSHLFYSDDHGGCWKLGGVLGEDTNECEVVQTCDGSLYINMRSYKGNNRRAYAWSKDGGITWSEVFEDDILIEPVCQASIVSYNEDCVLFSNPASTKREKMTVKVSYDECRTWTVSKVLNPGPSGYSNLAVASDMTICCLYERGESDYRETITFAQFSIEWLTDGAN
ncbi:exo-alpha-sialidase [bacterium]|nr:exo-alpha-sialidase [bacterium]